MLKKNVAEGIHCVEDSNVNWFIVEGTEGLTIIDAGLPTSWTSLQQALQELGRQPQEIKALLLTHGHFDHLGFAERLRSELGVPVYVHDNDVPLTRPPASMAVTAHSRGTCRRRSRRCRWSPDS